MTRGRRAVTTSHVGPFGGKHAGRLEECKQKYCARFVAGLRVPVTVRAEFAMLAAGFDPHISTGIARLEARA